MRAQLRRALNLHCLSASQSILLTPAQRRRADLIEIFRDDQQRSKPGSLASTRIRVELTALR